MAKSTLWKDEYTLLCEKCGYVIEGLDTAGPCPECGKPIEESLPERRVGTPWQQKPGVKSLVRTWWMTLRHPLRTIEAIDPYPSEPGGHFFSSVSLTFIISLVIWTAFVGAAAIYESSAISRELTFEVIFLVGTGAVIAFGLTIIYTLLISVILFILRIRFGQRSTHTTIRTGWIIAGHGASGWNITMAGLLMTMMLITTDVDQYILWISLIAGPLYTICFCYAGLRYHRFTNHYTLVCKVNEPTQTDTRTT